MLQHINFFVTKTIFCTFVSVKIKTVPPVDALDQPFGAICAIQNPICLSKMVYQQAPETPISSVPSPVKSAIVGCHK